MFNPIPEWDSSRLSQRSFSQAPAPLPQSSFCSLAARSSFVTDATSSSLCFAPGGDVSLLSLSTVLPMYLSTYLCLSIDL